MQPFDHPKALFLTTPVGARIAVTAAGAGEPVILLHSSASAGAQWRALVEELSLRFRVFVPDLYGYGMSDPWPGPAPMCLADEAEHVGALLARCGEPLHLVGHSFGGLVALHFASRWPQHVRTLTLYEPVAFGLLKQGTAEDRAGHLAFTSLANTVADACAGGEPGTAMARFVDYWNGPGAWTQLPDEKRAALSARAGAVVANFQAATAAADGLFDCRGIRAPTLLLAGTESPGPTRRIVELLAARIPVSALGWIRGGGHMAPLTHRGIVNAHICEHLAANTAAKQAA